MSSAYTGKLVTCCIRAPVFARYTSINPAFCIYLFCAINETSKRNLTTAERIGVTELCQTLLWRLRFLHLRYEVQIARE